MSQTASPYEMKEADKDKKKLTPTVKAFENSAWLHQRDSRMIRVLCEFSEPADRLRKNNVKGTVLFFGSARSMKPEDYEATVSKLKSDLAAATSEADKKTLSEKIAKFEKVKWMCPYCDITEELARLVTEWSMTNPMLKEQFNKEPDYLTGEIGSESTQPLVVTTGGGPGIMEAANKGAAAGGKGAISMGMGISLPFEKGLNPYVSDGLAFEFHYFFTRKFWMMYSAKALIVGPGGFGTMDEMFELLTLRQTGKIPDLPIVLLGAKYWQSVVNWQAMADFGTISQGEVDRLFFTDSAQDAFEYIKREIGKKGPAPPPVSPGSRHADPQHGRESSMEGMELSQ